MCWKTTTQMICRFKNQTGSRRDLNSDEHPMAIELETEDLLALLHPGEVLRQEFRVPRGGIEARGAGPGAAPRAKKPHCERRPNEIA